MFVHRTQHTVAALLLFPLALACRDKARPTSTAEASAPVVSASVPDSKADSGTISTPASDAPVSYVDAEQAFHRGSYGEATQLFEGYRRQHPDNPWGHYMYGLSA
ncbi:MAG TPA: hypothetical protein VM387_12245, partial [Gemmatimonadales bacterium]|nr:hypothetical protein [Gemmatimonadales bacterium]